MGWRLAAAPPVWYVAFWVLMFLAYCAFWFWMDTRKNCNDKPTMATAYIDSGTATLTPNVDHWFAITHNGLGTVKWIVDGVVISTMTAKLQTFGARSNPYEFIGSNDNAYPGRQQNGPALPALLDVRRERAWQRELSLAELIAEAASSTPVIASNLVSNVGLTGVSDVADTVAGRNFVLTGPTYISEPVSSGDGYVRLSDYSDSLRRQAGFLDLTGAWTSMLHVRNGDFSANAGYLDVRFYGNGPAYLNPWIWVGMNPNSNDIWMEIAYDVTETVNVNSSPLSCHAQPLSGGSGKAGEVLPAIGGGWSPACAGGGSVASSADPADSESWSS